MIEALQNKLAEQAYLVAQLGMWNEVRKQGIDPEDVATFTWRDEFITPAQKRERCRATRFGHDPFADRHGVRQYNAVRLKDGTLKQLSPTIARPQEPVKLLEPDYQVPV